MQTARTPQHLHKCYKSNTSPRKLLLKSMWPAQGLPSTYPAWPDLCAREQGIHARRLEPRHEARNALQLTGEFLEHFGRSHNLDVVWCTCDRSEPSPSDPYFAAAADKAHSASWGPMGGSPMG
eukprot:gene8035-biopygen18099